MRRRGQAHRPGIVLALNNRGDGWSGATVKTGWAETRFTPVAWGGRDGREPQPKRSDAEGVAEF